MTQAEVGARRAVETLMDSMDRRLRNPAGLVVRVWGYLLVLFAGIMHIVFGALGATATQIAVWLAVYLAYLLLLEFARRRISRYYDNILFRSLRILFNLGLITWLIAISPNARPILWLFYVIPIFAAIVYFTEPIRAILTLVGAVTGLFIGSVMLADETPLTIGQYCITAAVLSGLSFGMWWLFESARLGSSRQADMARKLHHTLDLETLVVEVVEISARLSGAERSLIIIVDPQSQRYITHTGIGFNLREGRSVEELAQKCTVLRDGRPFETNDVVSAFRQESLYIQFFHCKPRSILAEPLFSKDGRVLGVLNVAHDSPGRFDRITRDLIRQISYQVGSAVENCLSYRQARLREAKHREVSKKLAAAITEEEIATLAVTEARALVPIADGSVLHRFEPRTDELHPWAVSDFSSTDRANGLDGELHPWTASHIDPALLGRSVMRMGVGVAGHALELSDPILVPDVTQHPWFVKSAQVTEFTSLMVAALTEPEKGGPLGTLSLHSKQKAAFKAEDEVALVSLVHQAALALAKVRSFNAWKQHGGAMKRIFDEVRLWNVELEEEQLCEQIVQSAQKVLGFEMARIRLLDPGTDELITVATAGIPAEDAVALKRHRTPRMALEPLLSPEFKAESSYFIRHGHDVWTKIPSEHFYTPAHPDYQRGWQQDDALLTPLMGQSDTMIGLLTVDLPESGAAPLPQTIEALGVFASAATWAIERARSRRRLRDQHRRVEDFMNAVSDELAKSRDVKAVGEVVVQIGAKLLSAEGCSLYLVRDRGLELKHSSYLTGTSYIGRRKPISSAPQCGLTAWVAATGQIVRSNNGEHEALPAWSGEKDQLRYLPSGECRSLLIIPVRTSNQITIGVLSLENKKLVNGLGSFNEDDERRLLYLAKQLAQALEAIDRYDAIAKWERRGLEDDLHELINWYHSGVVLWIDSLNQWLDRNKYDRAKALMPSLMRHAHTAINELKTIHTAVISEDRELEDVAHALRNMADAWSKRATWLDDGRSLLIDVNCPEGIELPAPLRGTFLRVASGAVANAIMHSGALRDPNIHIRVSVELSDDLAVLRVTDNGRGQEYLNEGYGITRMRQLVRQLNDEAKIQSEFNIDSVLNTGTTVTISARLSAQRLAQKSEQT